MGSSAGRNATSANNSNFMGNNAGYSATSASNSNFLGVEAGYLATDAFNSNFIGNQTGQGATGATNSNFIGRAAGQNAINAYDSNFIGYRAGFAGSTSDSVGSNNIIIGTNITLSAGTTNSLNIGNVLYGVNTYSTTGGNPSITPQANGRIGIGVVTPQETLHVVGNTRIQGGLSATTISATTYENLPQTKSENTSIIHFSSDTIFGSFSSPLSSNLTNDLTNAKLGVVQKIYHNSGTAPSVPAGWVLIGSTTYQTSTLNIIYAEWSESTRVEYWIVR
jgi:hypothetical protein